MAQATKVLSGADGAVQSTSINTAEGVLRRPAVKMARVFNEFFRDEMNTLAMLVPETWKTLTLENLSNFLKI